MATGSTAPPATGRDVRYPAGWRAEVARWLRRPDPGDPGPGGWVLALLPEVVDPGLRFDRPALQVYQRVAWRTGLPSAATVSAATAWRSPAGERSELALATEASTEAGVVARALLVARLDGPCDPFGQRRLPPRPADEDLGSRGVSLMLDREQVQTFARLAGVHHPIHDDPAAARRLGYPDVLVQGAVLLLTVMHFGRSAGEGMAEMWFHRPVPAGSALQLVETGVGAGRVWTVATSTGEPAAVARLADTFDVQPGPGRSIV